MSILDLIARAEPALHDLDDKLAAIIAAYPDSAVTLQPILDKLRLAADPLSLAALGSTVLSELTQFAQTGRLDPRPSPSNLA